MIKIEIEKKNKIMLRSIKFIKIINEKVSIDEDHLQVIHRIESINERVINLIIEKENDHILQANKLFKI